MKELKVLLLRIIELALAVSVIICLLSPMIVPYSGPQLLESAIYTLIFGALTMNSRFFKECFEPEVKYVYTYKVLDTNTGRTIEISKELYDMLVECGEDMEKKQKALNKYLKEVSNQQGENNEQENS